MRTRLITLILAGGILASGITTMAALSVSGGGKDAATSQYGPGRVETPINSVLTNGPNFRTSSLIAFKSGPAFSRRRRGSRVTFRLATAARVRFTVEIRRRGRYRKLRGSFTVPGKAGTNRFLFRGRIGGKTLKPGRYRLVAQVIRGRQKSRAKRSGFRVVTR